MSGIGGGGSPASVGSAGDFVYTLLHAIETPETFKERLNALKEAEDSNSAAIQHLADTQNQIRHDQAVNEIGRKEVEQAKSDFAAEKKRILDQAATFDQLDHSLTAREAAVVADEKALKTATQEAMAAQNSKQAELKAREAAIKKLEGQLADREERIAILTSDLTAKNVDLDKRINAIRAMAQSVVS